MTALWATAVNTGIAGSTGAGLRRKALRQHLLHTAPVISGVDTCPIVTFPGRIKPSHPGNGDDFAAAAI